MMTDLTALVRTIPDYPKPGIMFRDITTLILDPKGFTKVVNDLAEFAAGMGITKVAGIEARGFIIGGALAHRMSLGFVPLRKKGKLPYQTIVESYELEYGTDQIEMHLDAVNAGDSVLLIDDLIATGGTALAGVRLLQRGGAKVAACAFVIDLPDLGGAARLEAQGLKVHSLIAFGGH
jgi:adenine phosphoribosyltransferase